MFVIGVIFISRRVSLCLDVFTVIRLHFRIFTHDARCHCQRPIRTKFIGLNTIKLVLYNWTRCSHTHRLYFSTQWYSIDKNINDSNLLCSCRLPFYTRVKIVHIGLPTHISSSFFLVLSSASEVLLVRVVIVWHFLPPCLSASSSLSWRAIGLCNRSVCPSASTLSLSHFLIDFYQNRHRRKHPQKE